jgi:hypothetical protein
VKEKERWKKWHTDNKSDVKINFTIIVCSCYFQYGSSLILSCPDYIICRNVIGNLRKFNL